MQPSSQTSQRTPSNHLESDKNKDQLNLPVTLKNQGRQGSLRKYKHPSKGQLSICEQRERCFLLDGGRKTLNTPYYDGLKDKHLTEFLVKSTTLQLLKKHGVIKKFKQDGSNLVIYKDPLKDPLIRRNVFTTLPPGILSKPKYLEIESNKPFTRDAFSSSAQSPLSVKQSELGAKPATTTEQKSINYNHGRSESEANFFKHSRKTTSQENTNNSNKYKNSTAELKMREIVMKNGYREKNSSAHSQSTKNQKKNSELERDETEKHKDRGYLPLSGGQQQSESEQKQIQQDTQLIDGHVPEESSGRQYDEQHGSPINIKQQYSRQTPNINNSNSKESTNSRIQLLGYSPITGKQKRPKFNQVLPPFKMYKCPKIKQSSNGGGESSSNISVNASMTKEDFTKMIGKFKEKVQNTLKTAETKGITILEENPSNLPSSHVKEGHSQQ